MIAAFDLPQIGRSPARFDFAKLENLNGHYIRASADAELIAALEQLLPHIAGGQELASKMTPGLRDKLMAAMPGLKERAKTLVELFDASRFIWASRPLALDDKAKALLTPEARALIARAAAGVRSQSADWTAAAIEAASRLCRTARASSSARWHSRCAPRSPDGPPRRRSSMCWRCWAGTKVWRACATRLG